VTGFTSITALSTYGSVLLKGGSLTAESGTGLKYAASTADLLESSTKLVDAFTYEELTAVKSDIILDQDPDNDPTNDLGESSTQPLDPFTYEELTDVKTDIILYGRKSVHLINTDSFDSLNEKSSSQHVYPDGDDISHLKTERISTRVNKVTYSSISQRSTSASIFILDMTNVSKDYLNEPTTLFWRW
jgi:hypothetical protein